METCGTNIGDLGGTYEKERVTRESYDREMYLRNERGEDRCVKASRLMVANYIERKLH